MDDLISVIIPVYNVADYLDRCMRSVVEQTYCNLEIILVDDGSTDGSGQLCDLWAEKDSRVVVFHQNNMGQSKARNLGIQKSGGKYIFFLDSDDYLTTDAVQVLYERINFDKSDIAIGNGVNVSEADEIIGDIYVMVEDAHYSQQEIYSRFYWIPCTVWGKLYRSDLILGSCFPSLTSGEDLCLLFDVVSKCKSVSLCSNIIYYYTQRMSSMVHTLNDKKLFDSTFSAVYVCKKLAEANYWKAAKRFFTVALFRAVDMKDPLPTRKLFTDTFRWYMQMKLIEWNLHTVIRWMALYIPALHTTLKKRQGCV